MDGATPPIFRTPPSTPYLVSFYQRRALFGIMSQLPTINLTDDIIVSHLKQSGRMVIPRVPLDLQSLVVSLAKLVDWYNFGILLKVPPNVLRKIEDKHQNRLERRKADLYEY